MANQQPSRASRTAADVLGRVTLVTGAEEFLAERAVRAVTDAVRSADPDADITETTGADVGPGAVAELTSPSLFAASRAVVVRQLPDLPDDGVDGLLAYAASPAPDIALVLVHPGGQKGKGVLDRLRKAGVSEVPCETPKTYELPRFTAAEVRRAGGRISDDAAAVLVDAVGSDLRALAAAAGQLASDFAGEPVTEAHVRRYFGGRAEVKGFAVADAAISGQVAPALEQLRWALGNGVVPVLVTSAFASGLRGLARYTAAPQGMREGDLAREVGVPPWKLRSLRSQARGWSPTGLADAITAVARADADVKGASGDPDHALERMVLAVAAARGTH
ncbi:MAG: DNA polymerase III subunit delta [Actinomycetota bacterium]|nr:DNA polymerase III subunit delta [Actinomycetota bacterium]MDQ4084332.1 DNA polymerase III subunit delta [Actinomycetota bacterium]